MVDPYVDRQLTVSGLAEAAAPMTAKNSDFLAKSKETTVKPCVLRKPVVWPIQHLPKFTPYGYFRRRIETEAEEEGSES